MCEFVKEKEGNMGEREGETERGRKSEKASERQGERGKGERESVWERT